MYLFVIHLQKMLKISKLSNVSQEMLSENEVQILFHQFIDSGYFLNLFVIFYMTKGGFENLVKKEEQIPLH